MSSRAANPHIHVGVQFGVINRADRIVEGRQPDPGIRGENSCRARRCCQ